jgi:hypothetical protein
LFKAWRHYLEGANHQVDIFSDHKNLIYFAKAQILNQRQARWATFLSQFNFQIFHKAGTSNHLNPLSRQADHRAGLKRDKAPKVLFLTRQIDVSTTTLANLNKLKSQIIDASSQDVTAKAVRAAKQSDDSTVAGAFNDWRDKDGILVFCEQMYVPHDNKLRREVIRINHDLPAAGRPGQLQTHELAKRKYYWPGMKRFVAGYVQGCAECQVNKIHTHPPVIPLLPNEVPSQPFQIMSTDSITDLPLCKGFDAISIWVDQGYKTVYIVLTRKTVTSA